MTFLQSWNAILRQQLDIFLRSLLALGVRRLAILGTIMVVLMATIGFAAVFLNRPTFETLYVGLDRDDVNRVGIALSEAGFRFDVDSSGSTVLVEAGAASRARMVLAEKGLPASSGAGYELFDNLGSLGLTSFMQEVTRVRALEGEIARSIQAVNGVKSARVHIVMPDRTAFRDRERKPTASILIKADNDQLSAKAFAIRHLVAAAVPGLASDDVTIMDSAGKLLASGQDQYSNALTGALETQRNIENDIEQKISNALGPQLGALNYRISVQAQIDTDRRTIQETIYDPNSKVERSIQVTKAEDSSSQKAISQNTSVAQNLPQATPDKAAQPVTDEKSQKREETTNYEISSKQVDTQRNGFRIDKLAISVVLNKTKIDILIGGKANQTDVDARLAEIRKIVATTAGVDPVRGDKLNISALAFVDDAVEPAEPLKIMAYLAKYVGTAINSIAFIIVVLLIIFLAIRPIIKTISTIPINTPIENNFNNLVANPNTLETKIRSNSISEIELDHDALRIKRLRALAETDPEIFSKLLRKWIADEGA